MRNRQHAQVDISVLCTTKYPSSTSKKEWLVPGVKEQTYNLINNPLPHSDYLVWDQLQQWHSCACILSMVYWQCSVSKILIVNKSPQCVWVQYIHLATAVGEMLWRWERRKEGTYAICCVHGDLQQGLYGVNQPIFLYNYIAIYLHDPYSATRDLQACYVKDLVKTCSTSTAMLWAGVYLIHLATGGLAGQQLAMAPSHQEEGNGEGTYANCCVHGDLYS